MTRRYLERMADEALNRVNERRHSKDMWSREEADAQEEDVVLSVLPGSFRNRVEVAMKRNELSRNPQETGKSPRGKLTPVPGITECILPLLIMNWNAARR